MTSRTLDIGSLTDEDAIFIAAAIRAKLTIDTAPATGTQQRSVYTAHQRRMAGVATRLVLDVARGSAS